MAKFNIRILNFNMSYIGNTLKAHEDSFFDKEPILILGPSGSGKEFLAKKIAEKRYEHYKKNRINDFAKAKKSSVEDWFCAINVSYYSDTLLEAKLFGYVKGAFTGATTTTNGLFTDAGYGVILLDEIGDCPPQIQGKLLRVLNDGKTSKMGAHKEESTNCLIIAATNREDNMRDHQRFRNDLLQRFTSIITLKSIVDELENGLLIRTEGEIGLILYNDGACIDNVLSIVRTIILERYSPNNAPELVEKAWLMNIISELRSFKKIYLKGNARLLSKIVSKYLSFQENLTKNSIIKTIIKFDIFPSQYIDVSHFTNHLIKYLRLKCFVAKAYHIRNNDDLINADLKEYIDSAESLIAFLEKLNFSLKSTLKFNSLETLESFEKILKTILPEQICGFKDVNGVAKTYDFKNIYIILKSKLEAVFSNSAQTLECYFQALCILHHEFNNFFKMNYFSPTIPIADLGTDGVANMINSTSSTNLLLPASFVDASILNLVIAIPNESGSRVEIKRALKRHADIFFKLGQSSLSKSISESSGISEKNNNHLNVLPADKSDVTVPLTTLRDAMAYYVHNVHVRNNKNLKATERQLGCSRNTLNVYLRKRLEIQDMIKPVVVKT